MVFLSHQWAWPQLLCMAISIGGMLAYFSLVSANSEDLLGVSAVAYSTPIYWFWAFFTAGVATFLVDFLPHGASALLWPSDDMLYREVAKAGAYEREGRLLRCAGVVGVFGQASAGVRPQLQGAGAGKDREEELV